MNLKQIGCWAVIGCLLALGQCDLYSQQSKIPWSAQSAGFAVMTSGSVITKSSVGQMAIGEAMNSSIRVQSGFLADTTLRGIILAVNDENKLPVDYSLEQNYPNPFNPITSIQYSLSSRQQIKLTMYDMLGREVQTLVDEVKAQGTYTVKWDGKEFPSGVYFYRLTAGTFTDVRRLLLIK